MSIPAYAVVEAAIERLLEEQWDPLTLGSTPEARDAYTRYAHDVFGLIARGASDVQIGRYLHRAESDELHHPELAGRDLGPLVREIRALEKKLGPSER